MSTESDLLLLRPEVDEAMETQFGGTRSRSSENQHMQVPYLARGHYGPIVPRVKREVYQQGRSILPKPKVLYSIISGERISPSTILKITSPNSLAGFVLKPTFYSRPNIRKWWPWRST